MMSRPLQPLRPPLGQAAMDDPLKHVIAETDAVLASTVSPVTKTQLLFDRYRASGEPDRERLVVALIGRVVTMSARFSAPSEGSETAGAAAGLRLSATNDSPAMDGGVFAKSGAPETNTQAAE